MVRCQNCGEEFSNRGIGHHWRQSNCNYPKPNEKQEELLKGILMSDATIQNTGKYPLMRIGMTNEKFLNWLSKKLGIICSSVVHSKTAEQSAKETRKTGFRPNAKKENYHDIYELTTRSIPYFENLQEWYSEDGKTIPETNLTPCSVKMWYCGDGNLAVHQNTNYRHYAQITCANESENIEKIVRMFNKQGFTPSISKSRRKISFSNDDTEKLLDWMGSPPKGFEYKWESKNYKLYKQKKKQAYKD